MHPTFRAQAVPFILGRRSRKNVFAVVVEILRHVRQSGADGLRCQFCFHAEAVGKPYANCLQLQIRSSPVP